jgi:cobalt-zinc-cadmium efflux system membrane fusion protein
MRTRALLAVMLLAVAGCGQTQQPPASRETRARTPEPAPAADVLRIDPAMLRDLRMTTARVEQRTAAADVDMLGDIDVNRDAYAEVAPPIDAQIVQLHAGLNDTVGAGSPLADLRSPDVGRARSELAVAEARARLTTQTLDRKRALAAERIVAIRDVQEAESQQQEAQAGLRAATSAVRALGVEAADASGDPSRFVLRSPIAGTILERRAAIGQLAQTAEPLFRVANLDRLWLTVHAFERDAVQLRTGTAVRITLAAIPGRELQGQVSLIGRQVDASSRTVDVRVELPNRDGLLRPGMSATAHVPLESGQRELLSVPVAAVQRVGEAWIVFLPAGEGTFRMRPIGRGRDLGAEVEVASGLQPADTVVVEGAFLLKAAAEKRLGGEHEH